MSRMASEGQYGGSNLTKIEWMVTPNNPPAAPLGHRLLFGSPPVPGRGMSERAARAIHPLGLHPKIPLLGSVTLFSVRRESNFFLMGSVAGFPRDFSKGCKVTPVRPDPRADLKRSRVASN
jgi:hypothetical protein